MKISIKYDTFETENNWGREISGRKRTRKYRQKINGSTRRVEILKVRSRPEVGRLNILSLLASFAREIRAWNSLHNRREYASWEGLLPGSSSLVTKCIPVFVKVQRCIYSSGYPHTNTITLSSIVVSDFLPPLVMTSLLEQAPDWLTRREYPPKFRFFNLRGSREWGAAGLSIASLHWLNM